MSVHVREKSLLNVMQGLVQQEIAQE